MGGAVNCQRGNGGAAEYESISVCLARLPSALPTMADDALTLIVS